MTGIFGKDDLVSDLKAIGLAPGDGVFVHTALSKVGRVIGGPRGLIEALVEVVGKDGLIGMPGFSDDAYDPGEALAGDLSDAKRTLIRAQVPGFDPARSNAAGNGAVPEAFRSWPGVVRSAHPTSSVLLYGSDAHMFAENHDPSDWATGPNTPWGRLRDRPRMKILLIGVGWNRCSALHAAESLARHRRIKMRHFKHGTGQGAEWIDAPDVADDLGRLFPLVGAAWEATGKVGEGAIGDAPSKLCGYQQLVDFATQWIDARNKLDGIEACR